MVVISSLSTSINISISYYYWESEAFLWWFVIFLLSLPFEKDEKSFLQDNPVMPLFLILIDNLSFLY